MQKEIIIDSHIHFDLYHHKEQTCILKSLKENQVTDLITVSKDLQSSKENLTLSRNCKNIHPAFGYHPEQALLDEKERQQLTEFIFEYQEEMIAVGEVGLPYYLRKEEKNLNLQAYIDVLEHFIIVAKKLDKPIILHAVYEDAPIVCDLLEKHDIKKAHFHWFKGDMETLSRLQANGYFISVTPDIIYKEKIQKLVKEYPLNKIMVETDGPWAFEGPFSNELTHPKMIHRSLEVIAEVKEMKLAKVYKQIYENTRNFYFKKHN